MKEKGCYRQKKGKDRGTGNIAEEKRKIEERRSEKEENQREESRESKEEEKRWEAERMREEEKSERKGQLQ